MSAIFGKAEVSDVTLSKLEHIFTSKCMQTESTSFELLVSGDDTKCVTANRLTRICDGYELLQAVRDELDRRGLCVVCATSWCEAAQVYVVIDHGAFVEE